MKLLEKIFVTKESTGYSVPVGGYNFSLVSQPTEEDLKGLSSVIEILKSLGINNQNNVIGEPQLINVDFIRDNGVLASAFMFSASLLNIGGKQVFSINGGNRIKTNFTFEIKDLSFSDRLSEEYVEKSVSACQGKVGRLANGSIAEQVSAEGTTSVETEEEETPATESQIGAVNTDSQDDNQEDNTNVDTQENNKEEIPATEEGTQEETVSKSIDDYTVGSLTEILANAGVETDLKKKLDSYNLALENNLL